MLKRKPRWALIIPILLLLLVSNRANANWSVGLGGYTEMMGHLQSDSVSKNGLFEPNLSFTLARAFSDSALRFYPSFTLTFLSTDDSHSAQLISLNPEFAYRFYENIDARFGIGLMFRRISGDGGTVVLRNGATGTVNGFRPARSETAMATTLNLGFDCIIHENFKSHLQFYIQGLLGGAALQVNNFVGVSYVF